MSSESYNYKVVYRNKLHNGTGWHYLKTEYYSDLLLAQRKMRHLKAGELYERIRPAENMVSQKAVKDSWHLIERKEI